MPDFRMNDYRAEDGRLREAGLPAAGLFAMAGVVAMRDGTDGWVPMYFVRSWPGGPSAAKKLCSEGLWTRHQLGTRDGYLFDQDEWEREQRSAAQVEKDKADAAARARKARQKQKDAALRASGQLTTGPIVVPDPPPEEEPASTVTRDATRDDDRTSHLSVTAHVTPMRHAERALLPPPPPPPRGGYEEEEISSSERANPGASSAETPSGEPQRSAHGQFMDRLRSMTRDELVALDRRCDVHFQLPPGTATPACTDCQRHRRAIDRVVDEAGVAQQQQRTTDTVRARVCPDCDEHRWRLGPDGAPLEPAQRCDHPRVPHTGAALTGAAP